MTTTLAAKARGATRFALELSFSTITDGGGDGGGGGDAGGASGDGGGGHGEERAHALGGPSTDEDPSTRTYDASHADAPENISPMSVKELVSQPEMSASNAEAP